MGKPCAGYQTGNSDLIKDSKAFCEGMAHRAKGTAAAYPQTDNPHGINSDANFAWLTGWAVANDAAGGVIAPSAAPCCGVPSITILA